MRLNCRHFPAVAILAACVQASGCSYRYVSEPQLMNPSDGVELSPLEERSAAEARFSEHKEISTFGRVHIYCSFPIRTRKHFDIARFQQYEYYMHYTPGEIVAFVCMEFLGIVILLPVWLLLDVGSLNFRGTLFLNLWLGTHASGVLPKVIEKKDVIRVGEPNSAPLEGAECRVTAESESDAGLRLIKEFSGATAADGDWFADLHELIPLLRAEDDVVLLRMHVSMPGGGVRDARTYLTAREIRELAQK